jgi:hypothetical protein
MRALMTRTGMAVAALGMAVALSWAARAHAADLPGPTADFSGVMVIRYPPSKPLTIRIAYTAQRVRREMKAFGTRFVTIVDRTRDRTVMLFPDLKRYAVRPLDPDANDTVKKLARNADIERVGPDTVNGRATVKYKLQGRSPRGRNFNGYLWLTAENIMVRMKGKTVANGKTRHLTIEMRDLRVGAVDPSLFEIPSDYEKVKNKKK